MAAVTVAVQDYGVLAALVRARASLSNLQPIYAAIGRTLERRVQQRFDLKEDPTGHAWQPWAQSTAARRKAEGRGTLLEYTGRMRASLAYDVKADGVDVGFGVPYAVYHEGLTPGKGKLPKRSMLSVGGHLADADADAVVKAALRELKRQMQP